MQGQDPGSRPGSGSGFGAAGNRLAAPGCTQRRGRRISRALAGTGVMIVVASLSATACGPEMFHQGVEDAGSDDVPIVDPGTGGVGGNPGDGLGGAGDNDAGSCPSGGGGVSGDASVPIFAQSFTFDTAPGLTGWSPVGQPPDTVMATTVAFDDQDGFPCAGSARMTIPFAAANSQVALGYNFNAGPQNLAGKVLTARVRLNSANAYGTIMAGLAYKSIGSVYLFASSAVPTIVPAQGWVTFNLSFDHPDGFVDTSRTYPDGATIVPDPTQVLEIDVLILTGSSPYITTDVSIDTVGISDE
jgi:hypothetical protein